MIKELLFAGLLAVTSFSPFVNIQAAPPTDKFGLPAMKEPTYSDLMRNINPATKLPNINYLDKKPYNFFSDEEGDYMSKLYKFKDFNCSMYFAVNDMNYTPNENEIEVKLKKYPKYITLEIPMLFQKTYIDKAQDGIDGNEKEYAYEFSMNKSLKSGHSFESILVDGPDFSDKSKKLQDFLKDYLNPKTGLLNSELLTEKPSSVSFFSGRLNVSKDYMLDVKINEKENKADMTICTLYFPVNDADFGNTKEKDTIILKLDKNPNYINLTKSRYDIKTEDVDIQHNLWFSDPKMDSINGNEIPEEDFFKKKKDNKLEKII